MRKIFKKGIDVEGMGNPITEWVEDNIGDFEDEKGTLKADIIMEMKLKNEKKKN